MSTVLWKLQLTKRSPDCHQCIKCYANTNPNPRCHNSSEACLPLQLVRGTRARGKATKLANLRHCYSDTVQSIWPKSGEGRVHFSKVSESHMSLKVNFSSCSRDSGILFSKTLKVVQAQRCERFSHVTLLCQQRNIFNAIYSEIAMLPQPIWY